MDRYGHLWIFMDNNGYVRTFMDIYGCFWILMEMYGYLWIFMDTNGYVRLFMDIHGNIMDIHGCTEIVENLWILMVIVFPGLTMVMF